MLALKGSAFEAPPEDLLPDLDLVAALGLDDGAEPVPRAAVGGAETVDIAAVGRRSRALWAAVGTTLALVLAGLLAVVRIPAPAAALPSAGLSIESEPSGAAVWVDGAAAGQAPVLLSRLVPGPHRVLVVREGYAPAEVQLQVTEGMGVVPLRFALAGVTAPVQVRGEDGINVTIDGHAVGRTPLPAIDVGPGVHELRFERRGFVPQRHTLLARAGEPLTIEARLLAAPVEAAPAAPSALPPPVDVARAEPRAPAPAHVEPPRPLKIEPARYPDAARRLQLEGSVLLEIAVDEAGQVAGVRVLESAGTLLDQAVSAAVRRWVFEPGRQDGRPVRTYWQYRQTFRPR